MSILYKFTIDNVETPEEGNIDGWSSIITKIERDKSELKGLLLSQDATFSFIGDLYVYVYNKLFTGGVCNEIDFKVDLSYDNGINYVNGCTAKIFSRDIELDILRGIGTIKKLTDDSFFARIDNNKSIGTVPDAGRSKNDISITKAPQFAVTLYDPATTLQAGTATPMFFVHDVMRYLVEFMSDGEVGFKSDFLKTELTLMLTNGYAIRNQQLSAPNFNISFKRLVENLRGLRDVSFGIEYDSNKKPILRFERSSFFYLNDIADTFENPIPIIASVDSTSLYSRVKFGSNPTLSQNDDPDVSFLEEIKYNGFKEEEFHVLGQCNIDQELNLVKDIAVSSNLIQHIIYHRPPVIDPDTSYDENLIFIHATVNVGAGTAVAIMTDSSFTPGTTPTFYNVALANNKAGQDYFTSFQGALASFLNFTVNDFEAILQTQIEIRDNTVPAIPLDPAPPYAQTIIYQAEVDPGNNFNLGTSVYTCPVTGFYTFRLIYKYDIEGLYNSDHELRVTIGIAGVNGLPVDSRVHVFQTATGNDTYPGNISASVYCTAGQTINTGFTVQAAGFFNQPIHQIFRITEANFSATATPDSGGIYQTYNQGDVQKLFFKIEYPLSPSRFENIANLTRSSTNTNNRKKYSIYWAEKNRYYDGHIYSVIHNTKALKTEIILKASVNSSDSFRIKVPAYRFEFDMLSPADDIQSFDIDTGGGGTNVPCGIPLNQDIDDIIDALTTLFAGVSVTFEDILVERIYIGGNKYHYSIIFVNPKLSGSSTTIDLIDVEGTVYQSVTIFM